MRPHLLVATAGLLVLGTCGTQVFTSGGPTPVGSPLCRRGTALSITAMDTKFDTTCLSVPANEPFTIRFDNEDSNTHNLDILDRGRSLFDGPVTIGPKVTTYGVRALPPGVYAFRCDVHPTQMHGTFAVGG